MYSGESFLLHVQNLQFQFRSARCAYISHRRRKRRSARLPELIKTLDDGQFANSLDILQLNPFEIWRRKFQVDAQAILRQHARVRSRLIYGERLTCAGRLTCLKRLTCSERRRRLQRRGKSANRDTPRYQQPCHDRPQSDSRDSPLSFHHLISPQTKQ